jgi:hypothetical protein
MNEIEEKLLTHDVIANQLKELKAKEAAMRNEICLELLKGKSTGTYNINYRGFKARVVKGVSYSLDQAGIQKAIDNCDLNDDELGTIKVKYELRLREYKLLQNTEKLNKFITVTDSMPTLEVIFES